MSIIKSIVVIVLLLPAAGFSATGWQPVPVTPDAVPQVQPLPTLREQAVEQQAWLAKRLSDVLPEVMRRHGIDMWILSMREYAEDPVFFSMVSPTTFAARRRSIYVFHDQGPGKAVARLALGGGDQGGLFTAYRDPSPPVQGAELVGDDQWRLLRKLVETANPKRIAVNIDPVHAFSDGLGAGIDGTIYTHPVGDHGHAAGPLIGLWDRQEGVPTRGDLKLRPATWFSIELQAASPIPEWNNRPLSCRQEEEAYLDDQGNRHWAYRRQERFHLVR